MTAWAVVVAAGDGTRLGQAGPKALTELAGRTLLEWSLAAAVAAPSIEGVVVACGASWAERCESIVRDVAGDRGRVCAGGATRHASVVAGLERLPEDAALVAIHDAARPFAGPDLFERCLAALATADGAVCGIPVTDTVKRCDGPVVIETVDRSALWRSQTPQAFHLSILRQAMAAAGSDSVTDEAVLLERAGRTVVVVAGDERNVKITTEADLAVARALAG